MNWRSGKFLALVAVLTLLVTALPIAAAQGPSGADKIEKMLLDRFAAEGRADFIVRFTEQADLSPAYAMGWQERGEFVVDTLTATAERSQARAKAILDGRGLRYQTFIAGNELYVWSGDLAAAQSLAALAEVELVRATRTYYVDPIVDESAPAVPQGPDALAWGITYTKADQFWTAFGVQGNGIVVANIDTGVQWNHPALDQAFKCGANPSDPACWADPSNICGGSACDNNGHGTHTMGTMVGDDDPSLTWQAGMAPNALWIACKGCESSSCSDYALNTCADWILQPGGSPANRPHVVNNSWGGGGCDTWYQAKVNAWRAAGTFPAFSAGNSGSGCSTLGSPGDYQESFASAAHDSSGNIASFSSRGPSCFGHDPYTKPNIASPGVNVCSSVPTNAWNCGYSGTSMASPHTAGAVALLWSCNPALIGQMDTTFQALQNSAGTPPAGNCGAPPDGQGNYTYGYGYLDVLAAGNAWCGNVEFGYIDGHVYDAGTGNPIEGASVTAAPGYGTLATTDPTGYYTMSVVPGTYNVTASKTGYQPQTAYGVVVVTDTVTTQDFHLTYQGQWMPGTQPTCFDLTRIDAEYYPGTGKVYILGGRSGSNTVGTIYAFDPVANTCAATGATMPIPISNYTVNLVNNGTYDLLCTFGGRDSSGAQTLAVQCYNPVLNTASQVATLPSAYTGYVPGAQVVYNNRVYIFGGFNPSSSPYELARTDRFNPVTNTFTQLGNLSLARSYIMATVVDGKIYAFGGTVFDGASLVAQTRTEVMADPEGAGTWDNAAVAELPQAGAEGRAFGFDSNSPYGLAGKIILAPAYAQWPGESNAVIAYDVASNTYDETFPDLITARRNNADAFVPICTDNPTDGLPGMWVIGGRAGSDNPPYALPEYYPLACPTAPTAEFDWDEPVCATWDTQFHDQSTGAPTEWFWDFDDGGTSTERNPVHAFASAGDFDVYLLVTNTQGSDDVVHTVTVNPLPEASFDYAPASGPLPLTVYFTNTSQYAQNPTWNFGDGGTGAGNYVNHTYTEPGTYTVTLTVESPYGCGTVQATAQVYVYLQPAPPTAAFSADPTEGCVPLAVTFTDESTGYPPITSWLWDFGDGATSTETNPVHTYTVDGEYTVLLTVENVSGTASVTGTITVYPLPMASFDYEPMVGYMPLTVYFTNTSDPLLAINPTWDFGDGEFGAGDYVSHTYVTTGTFPVVLTVESPYGCGTATAGADVVVYEPGVCIPVSIVRVNQSPTGCVVDFSADLNGSEPFTYTWNFGAFGTFGTPTATVDFGATGTYTGVLTVWNCDGVYSDTLAFDVVVECPAPQRWSIYLPIIFKGYGPTR